ncbi:MAG: hypothetical protein Q7J54_03195 [Candidatus Woesearchaeota archaeon]|nr:hypothetical protein [Candidatus Woesearchaeota archaeon]
MKKRRMNKQVLVTLFLAFIMVFSTFAVIFDRYTNVVKLKYNGHSFSQNGNLFATKINGNNVYFDNFPKNVEDINLSSDIVSRISNTKMLYITYDISQDTRKIMGKTQYDLQNALWQNFKIYAAASLMNESSYNLPVVSCRNATASVPVMELSYSNETGASLEGNCIFVYSTNEAELIRLKDRLLFGLFGIIK